MPLPDICLSQSQRSNLCPAVLDVELSRAADASVKGLFVAPTGSHTLCMVQVDTTTEVHYIHSRWKKAKVLGKLKGMHITAVAWNKQQGGEGSTGCGFGPCQGACQIHLFKFFPVDTPVLSCVDSPCQSSPCRVACHQQCPCILSGCIDCPARAEPSS